MSQDSAIGSQAETQNGGDTPQGPNPRTVRALLIVTIGLGVLLVVGAAVVIGTVIKRLNNPETIPQKPGFGTTEISIPDDAQLLSVENGDARIVLQMRDGQGAFLVLLDPRKGTERGRIRLIRE